LGTKDVGKKTKENKKKKPFWGEGFRGGGVMGYARKKHNESI
jgi:hypothetical protein